MARATASLPSGSATSNFANRQAGVVFDAAAGDDKVLGSKHADSFKGGAGKDTLTGNGGHDPLQGGAGLDTVTGGEVGAGEGEREGLAEGDTLKEAVIPAHLRPVWDVR